jgi:hypothetical protein
MSAALQDPRTDCAPLYALRCVMWRAWAALLAAFPYAATTPVDTMVSAPEGSLQ